MIDIKHSKKAIMDLQSYYAVNENFSRFLYQVLTNEPLTNEDHQKYCIILATLLSVHPDVKRFAMQYFDKFPSPFNVYTGLNTPKKFKPAENFQMESIKVTNLDIVLMTYKFLKLLPSYCRKNWSWADFVTKYYTSGNEMIRWICCHCIAIVTGLSEQQLSQLLRSVMSDDSVHTCTMLYKMYEETPDVMSTTSMHKSINFDETNNIICIDNIYLLKCKDANINSNSNLVEVNSTKMNLRKIALAVASNKAVCLQGPVGSGKTTLVEYLASKTGHTLGNTFVKIQLGDQTDSKMLLGTYKCTDIPGEFLWQPGVLTQAVTEGCWLLLEDIDMANTDIASLLTALLENQFLTIPGYQDAVPIASGFQLFVTHRLLSTATGYHKKSSNSSMLLEKHLLEIVIDPLSTTELEEIIHNLFPMLKTISNRIVDVFMLFSTNMNLEKLNLSKVGRLISTRDLFKWCHRAIIDFDVTSQNSALKVLQDATDIFCCSRFNPNERLILAREISTLLGIVNEKADYFCNKYKPHIALTNDSLKVGRVSLSREMTLSNKHINFCFTRPSACHLERVMNCVALTEPILLVGETGTGKTSLVQYLAHVIGKKLIVINMNQQSDSADLLGGYKPVNLKFIIGPVRQEFEDAFKSFFNVECNKKYLTNIAYCFNEQRWTDLVKLMKKSCDAALKRLNNESESENSSLVGKRRSKDISQKQIERAITFNEKWKAINIKLQKLEIQLKHKNTLAFSFVEGTLVKAIRNGDWVLLDEINLANAETLECLSGLLEGTDGSLCLLERGEKETIKRHNEFTLFACMNPSTDVGKKDLPAGLRNRFTEFYVEELTDKNDLLLLVNSYLNAMSLSQQKLDNIVKFYLNICAESEKSLSDGLGSKPHFSLRSLCRALMIAATNPCGNFDRSLYESFCLSFLTQLDSKSYKVVESMIFKYILGNTKDAKGVLKQPIMKPKGDDKTYVPFEGYWVNKGSFDIEILENYILTASVKRNLKDLVRIVSIGRLPVLLQGDTSVGKTSLIVYLAKSSGNKCVRINNHEHTDLQEYIGSYVADSFGKLVFREGVLVEAMRKGYWIILDELNLAPTDVLEALNRVLDDNRELFIPETQETVKADPNFMLFATQNPPGSYGGRKMLSRAFRNRFVELHFNEIPPIELEYILQKRCKMPPSYAKKMVAVMVDLQTRRRGSATFAGKQGFITLRDLFRWGERYYMSGIIDSYYDWDQHIADEGYLLLAGRVRKPEEQNEIVEVIQKHIKREVQPNNLFTLTEKTSSVTKEVLKQIYRTKDEHRNIVWTYRMRQLAILVAKALQFHEPVLLVGNTGCGKTTVCQLLAENNDQELITINCHMHTESSDFIGGLRPVREHTEDDANKLFEWIDGPLIHAVVKGAIFLADEISLADDSVLERLNSLLEPERTLLLAEKGSDLNYLHNSEIIVAHKNFHFIGTMNPGGDYGKKELSPALRNRFTEIWCDSGNDRNDLIEIIETNLSKGIALGNQEDGSSGVGKNIMNFIEWFRETEIGKRYTISIRNILSWVNFINSTAQKIDIADAYLHGAYLTFIDSFGSAVTELQRNDCMKFLINQLHASCLKSTFQSVDNLKIEISDSQVIVAPFYIEMGTSKSELWEYSFEAPTTLFNTMRLLRGLQLNKAILLEGSPGVGKTSLVVALAKYSRNKIIRINLSDQTDISDLFGADLPVEGGSSGQFAWKDGPFLQALKQGHWILLDELNLASQSVLEGLNACLDHRGEIYIPELDKTFHIKPGTRLFACQNPLQQGGSRRGLPQSFLNRFTQVYVAPLTKTDMTRILTTQFPDLPASVLDKMIEFNEKVVNMLETYKFGHKGSPWEFNLRDLVRWCEATICISKIAFREIKTYKPESVVNLIYCDRMRTLVDKQKMQEIFELVFKSTVSNNFPVLYVTKSEVYLGDISLIRNATTAVLQQEKAYLVLRSQLATLRSLAYCVNLNWMSIVVGNGGCGKSSVVQTLAKLVGKTIRTFPVTSAMDTTDILGGFEQTDYTKHLGDLYKQTETLLLRTVRKYFVGKEVNSAVELMYMWEKCCKFFQTGTDDVSLTGEAHVFLKKLQTLSDIWNCLVSNDEIVNEIDELRIRKKHITEIVTKEGNLNAGGKFEWIDSLLIKCLQDGSWLLIENVNLCSPAVLDRLNSLLEPNGSLTIGERGVNKDGEIVNIKPHKNFRLFLTMDPKNGEISRAMRNRGVEIYMLDEKENDHANMYDIKALINLEGLRINFHVDALINIHNYISELTLGDKPNIIHMLKASFLISQQLLRGINCYDAFSSGVVDVYCKSRSHCNYNSKDIVNDINAELQRVLSDPGTINATDLYSSDLTLRTNELMVCSDLEKITQQSALLFKYLQTKFDNNATNTKYFEKLTQYLLIHVYGITSFDDITFRYRYLEHTLSERFPDYQTINKKLFFYLRNIIDASNKSLPQDSRWVPDIININDTRSISNKTFLLAYFVSTKMLYEKPENEINKNKKQFSLLQYMDNVQSKKIDSKIDDVVVKNLLQLLDEFDTYFITIMQDKNLIVNDQQTIEVLMFLNWRFLLFQYLKVNINSLSSLNLQLALKELHLHYKWFFKFCIKRLMELLQIKQNEKVTNITTEINNCLPEDFAILSNITKHYYKNISKPTPVVNNMQLKLIPEFASICASYNIYEKNVNFKKMINVVINNNELISLLVKVYSELSCTFSEQPVNYNQIIELHTIQKEKEIEKICTPIDINILPVVDYFYLLKIGKLKSQLYETCGAGQMLKHAVTVPIELRGLLNYYSATKEEHIKYKLGTQAFLYSMKGAAVCPNVFLKFGAETDEDIIKCPTLLPHLPLLCYGISNICISDSNKDAVIETTKTGNLNVTVNCYRKLNHLLWKNMKPLSDKKYDFMYYETLYLQKCFEKFIEHLASSLNISNLDDLNLDSIAELCMKEIENAYMHNQIKENSNDKHILLDLLTNSHTEIKRLTQQDVEINEKLNTIANVYCYLNYLKAFISSHLPSVDPLDKIRLKKEYSLQVKEDLKCLQDSYELQNEVYGSSSETLHSYCAILNEKILNLTEEGFKLDKSMAVRPDNMSYNTVTRAIKHDFATILSFGKVKKLITDLNQYIDFIRIGIDAKEKLDLSACITYIKLSTSSVSSFENLITTLASFQHGYPDVVVPLLNNITEFLYGINLKISFLKKLMIQYDNMLSGINLNENLLNLIRFPILNSAQTNYTKAGTFYINENLQSLIAKSMDYNFYKKENLRLLKCSISEMFNNCIINARYANTLDSDLFKHFDNLIKLLVNAWKQQEEQLEAKRKEQENLYKTKNKSEEDEINEEFDQLFPAYYDDDFADMQQKNLDDENCSQTDNPLVNENEQIIKLEDIQFVFKLHAELVEMFTKSEWLNPDQSNVKCDFITPLIHKFKIFKILLNKYVESLSYKMDLEISASLNVLITVISDFSHVSDIQKLHTMNSLLEKHYDFYKDSNVGEVKSLLPILELLQLRINELLNDWPDHPTLQNISTVIARIYSFDITSPLSRFLMGCEILLTKCYEWEQNSHLGVSLGPHIQSIINLIITWRKIELNMWKDSLNGAFKRLNEPITKWWLYIYDIMEQFLEHSKYSVQELIETFQTFLLKSNLVEYRNRLHLLYIFHCHSLHLEHSMKREQFTNVLWNLHEYFKQFLPNVETKLNELRAPIEKKLKEYVKIVRWKDISYWAVKETLVKSHKILHKHIREYENVLKQDVAVCLTTSQMKTLENSGVWDMPQRHGLTSYHYTMDAATYMAKSSVLKKTSEANTVECKEHFLGKVEKYFNKSRLLCKSAIEETIYPTLILNLHTSICDILETANHLRNLEADKTLPPDKQKAHVKGILHQKHKALSDLFKHLSKIGVSFKTGLVESKRKISSTEFLIKPIDLKAAFNHLTYSRNDERLLTFWESCESYYNKSLIQLNSLESGLKNPAPDLGIQNIERCLGYSVHLSYIMQEQKVKLAETSRLLYYIKFYNSLLSTLCEGQCFMYESDVQRIINTLKKVIIIIEQYKIILQSCPENESVSSELCEVPILESDLINMIHYKNDDAWNKVNNDMNVILEVNERLLKILEKSNKTLYSDEIKLPRTKYVVVNTIEEIRNDLDVIEEKLVSILIVFGNTSLSSSLTWLLEEFSNIKKTVFEEKSEIDTEVSHYKNSIVNDTEKLLETIVITIQTIYKKYPKNIEESNAEVEEIRDNHLKSMIIENIFSDLKIMKMDKILSYVQNIYEKCCNFNLNHIMEIKPVLSKSVPMLEQIVLLFQYFVTQQVSAYRVTCKMNWILLNIFTDLATKGFCTPPELQGESSEEGTTQSSGGIGLGDGEGERDVSNKIESEDQLDDAQPAGQDKEKNEDKDCKEENSGIEMSEDFDSKLQDKEKDENDEAESNSDSDADEQMGETGQGAEQLDQQIWGSDGEDEKADTPEEKGTGGDKETDTQISAKENNDAQEGDENSEEKNEKEKNKADINELDEPPEFDDNQIDPHHGNQQELPEPEPMDLPDDLELDDNEEKEGAAEENPFDIDKLKENNQQEDSIEESEAVDDPSKKQDDDNKSINSSSDESGDELEQESKIDNQEINEDKELEEKDNKIDANDQVNPDEHNAQETDQHSAPDQSEIHSDVQESMDVDAKNVDNVKTNSLVDQLNTNPSDETYQHDEEDKGTGQSQVEESSTGHKGQAGIQEEPTTNQNNIEELKNNKRRPGESDSKRSLGETSEPIKKKLKTVDIQENSENKKDDEDNQLNDNNADIYQHITQAESNHIQILDTATQEQVEHQKKELSEMEEGVEDDGHDLSDTLMPEDKEDIQIDDSIKQSSEKAECDKQKPSDSAHQEGEVVDEMKKMDVEGEIVETITVPRGEISTHHIQYDVLKDNKLSILSQEEISNLRVEVQKQMAMWNESPSTNEAEKTWEKISSVTSSLAQDLSEQLRLVLEPTQASRLKGDYRTGRRINMRKIIPYIASQFRKDKIWLRRTKLSKRDYHIVLAIDDSSSMSDNKSKELTFESVALISKALTLLESGQLSVLSFGEGVKIVHKLTDTFTEKTGSKLLQEFEFMQKKTSVGKLVDFVNEMLNATSSHANALIAKLLIIVSDGRGIFSEGEAYVQQAIRRAKLSNIFMVFVIIDNPENRDSVLDIRMPVFSEGKLLSIKSYMDSFPFPFYLILRDINSLPNVLSDALRQWFEMVTNINQH